MKAIDPTGRYNWKYPLGKMKPGDSFPVSPDDVQKLRVYIYQINMRFPEAKLKIKRQADNSYICFRVDDSLPPEYPISDTYAMPYPKYHVGRSEPIAKRVGFSATSKYPFHLMRPGDSFPLKEHERTNCANMAVRFTRKYTEAKFSVQYHTPSSSYRCWRCYHDL